VTDKDAEKVVKIPAGFRLEIFSGLLLEVLNNTTEIFTKAT
jgi:hypothetical protein